MIKFSKIYKDNNYYSLSDLFKKKDHKNIFRISKKEIYKIADEISIKLSRILNQRHENRFSKNFWKIYLFPWVLEFVCFYYDRYYKVKKNLRKNVGFKEKISLSNIAFKDTREFIDSICWNTKTNYSYCNLINNLIKKKKFEIIYNLKNYKTKNKVNLYHFLFLKFLPFFNKIIIRGFSLKSIILNFLYYGGLIIPNVDLVEKKKFDFEQRKNLKLKLNKQNEFNKVLTQILPYAIPSSFVENFSDLENSVKKVFKLNKKIIFAESSVIKSDTLKFWIGLSKMKGSKFNIFQHGGAYTDEYNSHADLEKIISDKHYIFANPIHKKDKQYTDKIFLRVLDTNKSINNKIILPITYVADFNKHYEFPACSVYNEYYKEILIFLKHINPEVKSKLVLRMMPDTNKNDFFFKIIKRNFPDVEIDIPRENINNSLKNFSFLIGTLNSTVILQALLSGIPLLIFCNKNYFLPNRKYKKYYNILVKNNIMFANSIDAAKFINKNINNSKYWYNSKFKDARKIFIKNIIYKHYK